MTADLTIETLSIEIPANRRSGDWFKMEGSVKIDEFIISEVIRRASEKAKEKYPNVLISAMPRIHFSRRKGEVRLIASCEMCIGDGDYISRVVEIELPEINIGDKSEYSETKEEL